MRVMRGAGPAIPDRAGAHPSSATATPQLSCLVADPAGGPHHATIEGLCMDAIKRRKGAGRPHAQAQGRARNGGGGNAKQNYERYLVRAREAQLAGDDVEMERCFQYAEHYFRVMRAAGGT
jgi:hypothetical protein